MILKLLSLFKKFQTNFKTILRKYLTGQNSGWQNFLSTKIFVGPNSRQHEEFLQLVSSKKGSFEKMSLAC